MTLTIKTANNKNLILVPGISAGDYYELPGSDSWFSETDHGNIYFQEKQTGPFFIRLTLLHIFKKVTLYFQNQIPKAGVRIALQNKWNVGISEGDSVELQENQFLFFSPGHLEEKMLFEKGQVYRGIEVLCDPDKLHNLMDLFPGIAEYVGVGDANTVFLQRKPLWAPERVMNLVNELVGFAKDDNLFLLMNFLLMQVEHVMEEKLPSLDEIEAVGIAEKLIVDHLELNLSISEIAKKVNLNENRLKYIFRHVFKSSIPQYRFKAQMERAKTLLNDMDMPITDIAKACGYRFLTSFITSFRKFYGYPPGLIRRPAESEKKNFIEL
jgi:AraC-like DNA-binding protein